MDEQWIPEALKAYRDRIDGIDNQLLELLARRFEVTKEVGELKARMKLDSCDPVREQQKLDRLREMAVDNKLEPDFVIGLFQAIFSEVVANHRRLAEESQSV